MISPHTAPGTWVEIIETAISLDGTEGLIGTRFQIAEIIPASIVPSGYGALNPASKLYHCLSILKVVELPKAITDCLTAKPVDEDAWSVDHDLDVIRSFFPWP